MPKTVKTTFSYVILFIYLCDKAAAAASLQVSCIYLTINMEWFIDKPRDIDWKMFLCVFCERIVNCGCVCLVHKLKSVFALFSLF